jgi:tetratricopeptide (TPR) repeat protein
MTVTQVISILVTCALATIASMLLFAVRRYSVEQWLRPLLSQRGRKRRWVQRLIIGTDTDLKVEAFFFVYILTVVSVIATARQSGTLPNMSGILAVVALLQGFHFRQWLSKWRFRNIVFQKILTAQRTIYTRGFNEIAAIGLNNLIMIWLLANNPRYALLQVIGFVLHEVSTEIRKRSQLLRRKLHLFDLDFLDDKQLRREVIRAIRGFRITKLNQLALQTSSPADRIILNAFARWIQNDFDGFVTLFQNERMSIEKSPEMLYYFGKAFYSLGDLDRAEDLLQRGWVDHRSRLCFAYFVLCTLAKGQTPPDLDELDAELRTARASGTGTTAEMFAAAYYALAVAVSTSREPGSLTRMRDAFFYIHEAMRINQLVFDSDRLAELSREYFEANNQIFLDIYGYIVYRQGNLQLSFFALESAIRVDNTYPWPYFHIALIYERLGRVQRAESIYYRIAVNEVSDSVLKRLCERRLRAIADIAAKALARTPPE